jgi:hypothetical protein
MLVGWERWVRRVERRGGRGEVVRVVARVARRVVVWVSIWSARREGEGGRGMVWGLAGARAGVRGFAVVVVVRVVEGGEGEEEEDLYFVRW